MTMTANLYVALPNWVESPRIFVIFLVPACFKTFILALAKYRKRFVVIRLVQSIGSSVACATSVGILK